MCLDVANGNDKFVTDQYRNHPNGGNITSRQWQTTVPAEPKEQAPAVCPLPTGGCMPDAGPLPQPNNPIASPANADGRCCCRVMQDGSSSQRDSTACLLGGMEGWREGWREGGEGRREGRTEGRTGHFVFPDLPEHTTTRGASGPKIRNLVPRF